MLTLSLKTPLSVRSMDLLPFAPGNFWQYRNMATGSTFEVRVIGLASVNRRLYHVVRGFAPQVQMLRIHEDGDLVFWDENRREELLIAGFGRDPEQSFEVFGRECQQVGTLQTDRRHYDGPAGRWGAIECHYNNPQEATGGELRELYVENIGMVRRVIRGADGPETFDLVYAQVGKQVITAGETGRLNLSVLPGVDGKSWEATLTINTFGNSALKLQFPTEQVFDMRLLDDRGNAVWKWSAGRRFSANTSQTSVGGWTATARIPYPSLVRGAEQRFALEAWLTTAEGEPRFGSVTPVALDLR